MTALYIALFFVFSGAIAGGSMLLWRYWIASMPTPPRWMEAFRIVWVDCYQMPWEQRPRVIWIVGMSFEHNAQAVAGTSDPGAITVAFRNGVLIADTAFAHELRHAARRAMGIDPDAKHTTGDWQLGGAVWRAQDRLRKQGL